MKPDSQNAVNLERIICLLNGSDSTALMAFLQEKALNEDERPAVRVRALTALQPSLSAEEMFERLGLHSYDLDIRIKVLTFLSRLEVLGLVYKVCWWVGFYDHSFPMVEFDFYFNRKRNLKRPTKLHLYVHYFRAVKALNVALH